MSTWRPNLFARVCETQGVDLAHVADLTNSTVETVTAYAHGRAVPTAQNLWAIADVLEVSTTALAPLGDPPRMRELQWHHRISVGGVAKQVGMSVPTTARVLRGVTAPRDLSAWADALGTDNDTLLRAWETTRDDRSA